jgi:hypothetical protein
MPLSGAPSVTDAPSLAPADYEQLRPIEPAPAVGGRQVMVGSGAPLFRHPLAPGDGSDACAACHSTDTLCIAVDQVSDLVGKEGRYELLCRTCGKFSQYAFWR